MALLTVLVWGLNPFARGIRFAGDDLNFLFQAWRFADEPFWRQLLHKYPVDGWTRSLTFWPFVVVMWTPWPAASLQIFYGLVWLLSGVAVRHLALVVWPDSRLAAFMAGCLMVTATSDYQTNVIVYGPHLLGIALFFLGVARLLRAAEPDGTVARAVWGGVLLVVAFFTAEYMYPVVPFAAMLIGIHAGWRPHHRVIRALVVLLLAFVAPLSILMGVLLQGGTHASTALSTHVPLLHWIKLFGGALINNFWPVWWAFGRLPYYDYAPALPIGVFMVAGAVGSAVVVGRYAVMSREAGRPVPGMRLAAIVACALLAMTLVNAVSVNLGGGLFVRSHFVSRGLASFVLALVLAVMARRERPRYAAAAVLGAFVFLGVWGGVERQSYLLGYATNERREMASILEAVPGFDPTKHLIVIYPPGGPMFAAAENPNSIPFAYGDIRIWDHVIQAPNFPGLSSVLQADGAQGLRVVVNGVEQRTVDPEQSILLFFSPSQGRFVRLDRLPAGLVQSAGGWSPRYNPGVWLRPSNGRTPRVIAEVLGTRPSDAMRASPRKAPSLPQPLNVDPSLQSRLSVDSLAPRPGDKPGQAVTIGDGRMAGYGSLVWMAEPLTVWFSVQAIPGRATGFNRLVIAQSGVDGNEHRLTLARDELGVHRTQLHLARGLNMVEVWAEGAGGTLSEMWLRP